MIIFEAPVLVWLGFSFFALLVVDDGNSSESSSGTVTNGIRTKFTMGDQFLRAEANTVFIKTVLY